MKTRKVAIIASVTLALVALVGCSSDEPEATTTPNETTTAPEETTEAPPETTQFTAQFVNPLPNWPAWREIGDCMASKFEELGVDFTESGSSGEAIDATQMIQQLQQAIATGKNAVITFPASEAFGPVLMQAQEAGLVTGAPFGSGGEGTGVDFVVGLDWYEMGKTVYADAIAEREGEQLVGLIAQNDTGISKDWLDGVEAGAAEKDNVTIVASVFTGDDSSKALDQVNALLTANPEINVVATHMGSATQGAVAAITNKDAIGKVFLVGNGPDNGGKEAIESGVAYQMLLTPFCVAGEQVAETAFAWLNGDKSTDFVAVPSGLFGSDEFFAKLDEGWS